MANTLYETRLQRIMVVNCIYQNKYSVQDDEYHCYDSLQARLIEGIGIHGCEQDRMKR